ncbi:DoxX family protein [Nocardia thailandica]|uniref:DoxX family protein n=1 Tax=Nocardia thailandica TaxID=257275 RepID=A0ABW6PVN9_9NOCA
MNLTVLVITSLLAFAVAGSAIATLAHQPKLVAIVAAIGFPTRYLPLLGAIKLAAALGLSAGLLYPPLGIAAALGLVVYFTAALGMHIHARHREIAPAVVFLALSIATSALMISAAT